MWDSGANCSIFKNKNLLSNLRESDTIASISGIGGELETNQIGLYLDKYEVFYHPEAVGNILSQLCPDEDDEDYFIVFRRAEGLYCADHPRDYISAPVTVRENKPSDKTLPNMTSIINVPVSRDDVARSTDIFGPDTDALRGKTKKRKTDPIYIQSRWLQTDVEQILQIDLMFIDGDEYLISVLSPLDFIQSTHINGKSVDFLRGALFHQLAVIESRGYKITDIRTDIEGGIIALETELLEAKYTVNSTGAGQHVPVIERTIETVKERVRSLLHGLPYTLPFSFLRYLVEYVNIMLNLEPCQQREDRTSAYELFHGRKVDYERQLRITFGDYAEVHDPHPITNSMTARTQPCIALLPKLNEEGSYIFLNLNTRKTCVRNQWVEKPLDDVTLKRLETLAAKQGKKLRVNPHFSRGTPRNENNEVINVIDADELFANEDEEQPEINLTGAEQQVDPEVNAEQRDDQEEDREDDEEHRVREEIIRDREEQLDQQNPAAQLNACLPTNLYEEVALFAEPVHRIATRSRGPALEYGPYPIGRTSSDKYISHTRRVFNTILARKHKIKFGVFTNLNITKAIEQHGNDGRKAVMKEFKQLIRLKVLKFHRASTLSRQQLSKRIPSKTFVKVKFKPNGIFDKIKARFVGGGHRQDRSLYTESETSSPTISLVGLFIVATIAVISKEEARILIEMYPELASYLDKDGKLTAELMKALYGCIESGKLWFDTICSKLIDKGYKQNPYEPCIFNKWHHDRQVKSTVALYVDDLFISCRSGEVIEEMLAWLKEQFEELTITRGLIHQFTGMTFDFTVPNKVFVSMERLINDLLKSNGITELASKPYNEKLFHIEETSAPLSVSW